MAKEGKKCSLDGLGTVTAVAYQSKKDDRDGASLSYVSGKTIRCGNEFNGDIIPWDNTKYCSQKQVMPEVEGSFLKGDYTHCAYGNGWCKVSSATVVRYGKDGRWIYRYANKGIRCTDDVFGDPYPYHKKRCEYMTDTKNMFPKPEFFDTQDSRYSDTPALKKTKKNGWEFCSQGGGTCDVGKEFAFVSYGHKNREGKFYYRIAKGKVSCGNGFFNNPQNGIKVCFVKRMSVVENLLAPGGIKPVWILAKTIKMAPSLSGSVTKGLEKSASESKSKSLMVGLSVGVSFLHVTASADLQTTLSEELTTSTSQSISTTENWECHCPNAGICPGDSYLWRFGEKREAKTEEEACFNDRDGGECWDNTTKECRPIGKTVCDIQVYHLKFEGTVVDRFEAGQEVFSVGTSHTMCLFDYSLSPVCLHPAYCVDDECQVCDESLLEEFSNKRPAHDEY